MSEVTLTDRRGREQRSDAEVAEPATRARAWLHDRAGSSLWFTLELHDPSYLAGLREGCALLGRCCELAEGAPERACLTAIIAREARRRARRRRAYSLAQAVKVGRDRRCEVGESQRVRELLFVRGLAGAALHLLHAGDQTPLSAERLRRAELEILDDISGSALRRRCSMYRRKLLAHHPARLLRELWAL
ncbi:MAG: hypothetical protein AB7L13_24825 [Acidimicrobiia bacterium]